MRGRGRGLQRDAHAHLFLLFQLSTKVPERLLIGAAQGSGPGPAEGPGSVRMGPAVRRLPATPWLCRMKFFQLSAAPCGAGRGGAAGPWSCSRSPAPLHGTSCFQPSMTSGSELGSGILRAFIHAARAARGAEPEPSGARLRAAPMSSSRA